MLPERTGLRLNASLRRAIVLWDSYLVDELNGLEEEVVVLVKLHHLRLDVEVRDEPLLVI